MTTERLNPRLPDVTLPKAITVTHGFEEAAQSDVILFAVPTQTLVGVLTDNAHLLAGKSLVACCKGIDIKTLFGPVAAIYGAVPTATAAMLTGPSFAADIARGLPTALTLACADAESGFAEMQRLAAKLGALPETLVGLSGFGDLALTCTSEQSRNYRYGFALGKGETFDPTQTVEGAATAIALAKLSADMDIDLPICSIVAKLVKTETNVENALADLMSRPLKEE